MTKTVKYPLKAPRRHFDLPITRLPEKSQRVQLLLKTRCDDSLSIFFYIKIIQAVDLLTWRIRVLFINMYTISVRLIILYIDIK